MRYDGDGRANWVLHFDGGCWPNPGGRMAIGWHLDDENGDRVAEYGGHIPPVRSGGSEWASNNVAEFEALLAGLRWVAAARWASVGRLVVRGDSQLVVEVAGGNWQARKPHLAPLAEACRSIVVQLREAGVDVELEWVPRAENAEADALAELT